MVGFWRTIWVLLSWRLRGPVGLFDPSSITLRVMPGEIDFNLHMNNGRYFSAADIGRLDWGLRSGLWRRALRHGWRAVAGDSNARFSISLQPLQRYRLDSRLLGWNEKWFFCEHCFVRNGRVCAVVLVRYLFLSRRGKVPPTKVLQMCGYDAVSPPLPDWVLHWHQAQEQLTASLKAGSA
ncbi:Acyl-CoA thioesterase FadM [Fontimonas thermophila]|uniref:Acyl-CoA thioesterase FadM n=1 Tax=Fontimonas thermophila TaxID=1076937 RepID=A0A1I2J9I5_9GAMM|nr:thioesterase family protein [Fontimonas thermophila]SFF50728.1 Acyl-CoA thioesterase FadM [Fontimonas thermophila]